MILKECPKACRNFIQLCYENYYSNTIFHRLIPGFMIQGGDPTGTGKGGKSIYGAPFIDEFHQRLKFSHRGIVAMANSKPNDNESQFFITLDKCEWLNKRHTIFGKLVGDTQFNVYSLNNLETDSDDRPLEPPVIQQIRVVQNPFEDISARDESSEIKQKEKCKKQEEKRQQEIYKKQLIEKKKQNQGKLKLNLLSFADEEEQFEEEDKIQTIVSSHDVLQNDPYLKKSAVVSVDQLKKKKENQEKNQQKKLDLISNVQALETKTQINPEKESDNNGIQIRENLLEKKRKLEGGGQISVPTNIDSEIKYKTRYDRRTGRMIIDFSESESEKENSEESYYSTDSDQYLNEEEKEIRKKQKEEYEKLKINELEFKKEKKGTLNPEIQQQKLEEKKLLTNVELKRMKYLQKKKIDMHENDLMQKLEQFRKKLNSKEVMQNEDNWMNNQLKFHIDSSNAYKLQQQKEFERKFDGKQNEQIQREKYIYEQRLKAGGKEAIKSKNLLSIDQLMNIVEEKDNQNL